MSKRIREGFEPVRAETHPEFEGPTIDDGKHAGVIGVGGLILAKIDETIVDERTDYFQRVTDESMQAVDSELMRESNPIMPIEQPNRKTKTEFGTKRDLSED